MSLRQVAVMKMVFYSSIKKSVEWAWTWQFKFKFCTWKLASHSHLINQYGIPTRYESEGDRTNSLYYIHFFII